MATETKKVYEWRNKEGVSIIAQPLAGKKLLKKTLKLVQKAVKEKCLRRGIKEVAKAIRKGEKGLMILAGDVTPIDVICHLPIVCEDNDIPYLWVPSKAELGAASDTKRPTSCVLIIPKEGGKHMKYLGPVKEDTAKIAPVW